MSSDAQLAANRENSQLSTGPTSEPGKTISSKNALKTGLTGRTVLLPTDDAALYEAHVAHFEKHHAPANDAERNLVQALADTEWRLARIPSLEAGIYALGRLEFSELFPNQDDAVRKQLIEAKIFLTYGRQLNNLSIQESRLRRQREKDSAALEQLRSDRKRQQQARLDKLARDYMAAVYENRYQEFDPTQFGFEFSLRQIETRAMHLDPHLFAGCENDMAEKLAAARNKAA